MSAHVGDDAELYALGALEARERDAVDAHVASCDACAERVAEAERTVHALGSFAWGDGAATGTLRGARRATWSVAAALFAACFALAVGFGLRERASLVALETNDATIVATLAMSHFVHAPFVADVPDAPVAKVLYARDGSWLYVVVDAAGAWRLTGNARGTSIDLGPLAPRARSALLFVRPRARPDRLALQRPDGTVVAHVRLFYER